MALQLRLKRSDRVYRPGDTVSGIVVCTSEKGSPMGHSGITIKVTGTVSMQLSPKNVGLFEAFYASIKPIELMAFNIDVAPAGKLPEGQTELPFEFKMQPVKGQRLFETYHGVYVNIEYRIDCDMPRPRMQKNLRQTLEFMVEIPAEKAKANPKERVEFTIVRPPPPPALRGRCQLRRVRWAPGPVEPAERGQEAAGIDRGLQDLRLPGLLGLQNHRLLLGHHRRRGVAGRDRVDRHAADARRVVRLVRGGRPVRQGGD